MKHLLTIVHICACLTFVWLKAVLEILAFLNERYYGHNERELNENTPLVRRESAIERKFDVIVTKA